MANMLASKQRNYGIDLLRCVSMLMIVTLHVLSQGGVLTVVPSGEKNAVCWFIEIVAFCSVDCYALISGYVLLERKVSVRYFLNILPLWFTVFFYSFGVTALFCVVSPETLSMKDILASAFPVASNAYWYFSSYIALYMVVPFINRLIENLTKKELNVLVAILFAVFSVFATLASTFADPFQLKNGYSFVWLGVLYVIGAWVRKNDISAVILRRYAILGIMICVLLTWMLCIADPHGVLLLHYNSPTMIISAFFLLVLFSTLSFSQGQIRMIRSVAPATFGVYLIHTQHQIFYHLMKDTFVWIVQLRIGLIPVAIILSSALVFALCLGIEKLRMVLFSVTGLNRMIESVIVAIEVRCIRPSASLGKKTKTHID